MTFAAAAGYRRVTWGCDAHNAASSSAAQRLGFLLEATQRDIGVQTKNGVLVSRSETTLGILSWEWAAIAFAHDTWLVSEPPCALPVAWAVRIGLYHTVDHTVYRTMDHSTPRTSVSRAEHKNNGCQHSPLGCACTIQTVL